MSKDPMPGKSENGTGQHSEGLKRRDLLLSGTSLVAASALLGAGFETRPDLGTMMYSLLGTMTSRAGWNSRMSLSYLISAHSQNLVDNLEYFIT